MLATVCFDIMNSSDWWNEKFSIEANNIEEARAQALRMANEHSFAHNIQVVILFLPDGEQHYCNSGNMNRTTFRKVMPPDFEEWRVIPADCPREQ